MKVGTRSLLYGYHQVLLHPLFVAAAWWKLYGFPLDPRLWVAFFVHDIGYAGCKNMDGAQGKEHPFVGAHIVHFLFDRVDDARWYHFCLFHSRSIAELYFHPVSRLCYADKLAFLYYPQWLLRLLYWLSGEGAEYMAEDQPTDWNAWYAKVSAKNRKHVAGATAG